MGVFSMNTSMYCLLLVLIAVVSGLEHPSSQFGIGRAKENGTHPTTRLVSRHTRQTNVNKSKACSQIVYKTQCTGSYTQNYIDTLGQCSSYGLVAAQNAEKLCRQNSKGEYCGTVGVDSVSLANVQRVCTTCSSSCKSALLSLNSSHGCCLIDNPLLQLYSLSSYFKSCSISMPSYCPKTNLKVPSSATTGTTCGSSTTAFQRTSFSFSCSRQNLQPTLDALRNSNCDNFAQLNELSCSYRNGRYCYESLLTSNVTLANAIRFCPYNTTCSPCCSTSIANLNNELGCCVNLYNSSLQVYGAVGGGDLSPYNNITNNNLWEGCGITSPGICQARLTDSAILFTAILFTANRMALYIAGFYLFYYFSLELNKKN